MSKDLMQLRKQENVQEEIKVT